MPVNQLEKSILAKLIQKGGTSNVMEFLAEDYGFDVGFQFAKRKYKTKTW
ncbi:MAG: hypothetical protein KBF45_03010 [Cyclobacteriaceae bacterium]|jgi:hypothetical protein|nr:hypothetical protein [Cyclobacteriaceae bacterium]